MLYGSERWAVDRRKGQKYECCGNKNVLMNEGVTYISRQWTRDEREVDLDGLGM